MSGAGRIDAEPAAHVCVEAGDTEQWLTVTETSMLRGDWIGRLLGKIIRREYGERWIKERKPSVRIREEHERTFRRHIVPFLGVKPAGEMSTELVPWRAELLSEGRSEIPCCKGVPAVAVDHVHGRG